MDSNTPNEKVYIHEFIDIIGHNRASYMHHMTANFSPIAQEERHQLCYGVWGVVGSMGGGRRWSTSGRRTGGRGWQPPFGHEFNHAELQDPKLARWWADGGEMRRGGSRPDAGPGAVVPTITELCADGGGGRRTHTSR